MLIHLKLDESQIETPKQEDAGNLPKITKSFFHNRRILKSSLTSLVAFYGPYNENGVLTKEQRLRFAVYCASDSLKNNNSRTKDESHRIIQFIKDLPANDQREIVYDRLKSIREFYYEYMESLDDFRFYMEALREDPHLDEAAYLDNNFYSEVNAYKTAYTAYSSLSATYSPVAEFTSRRGISTWPFLMTREFYPHCAIISFGGKIDISQCYRDDFGNYTYDEQKVFKDNDKYLEYYSYALSMHTKTKGFPTDSFIKDYKFTNENELAILFDYLEDKYPNNDLVNEGKLNLPNIVLKEDNNLYLAENVFNNKHRWIISYINDIISGKREQNDREQDNNKSNN